LQSQFQQVETRQPLFLFPKKSSSKKQHGNAYAHDNVTSTKIVSFDATVLTQHDQGAALKRVAQDFLSR